MASKLPVLTLSRGRVMWNVAPQPRACSRHVCWWPLPHQPLRLPVATETPFQPVLVASSFHPTGPNLTQTTLQGTQSPKTVLGI